MLRLRTSLYIGLVALMTAVAFAACGGDDDTAPTPTPTRAASATATASAARTATPMPPPSGTVAGTSTPTSVPATDLARDPRYYTFEVSAGDTLSVAARLASGQPVAANALLQQIRELNQLTTDTLVPGQKLLLPLILPGDLALIPDDGIETAAGVGGKGGKLVLLQPSLDMRSGYKGRLVLAAVQVADGDPAAEGFGYLTRYAITDRPPTKAGERDPEARIADDAFTVAGGSLAPVLKARAQAAGAPIAEFTRDTVAYVVAAGRGAQLTPQQIQSMLQTRRER